MQRLALIDSSPALLLRIDQFLLEQWPSMHLVHVEPTAERLRQMRLVWHDFDALIIGFIEDPVAALELAYHLKNAANLPSVVFLSSSEHQVTGRDAFLDLAKAALPRETLSRFDLRNALESVMKPNDVSALNTVTRAISAHVRATAAEDSGAANEHLSTGPIRSFPSLAPRIAVVDSSYGSRTLISLFLRQRWPNAVVDAIDPFSETMHGLHSFVAPDVHLLVIGSIGALAEAQSMLARLKLRDPQPGVILLVSGELGDQADALTAAGAHTVLLRHSLSARDLIDAAARLIRQPGEPSAGAIPTRGALSAASSRGLFPITQGGERHDIPIQRFALLDTLAGNEHNHVFHAERLRDHKPAVIKVMNGAPLAQRAPLHRFIDLYVYLVAKEERCIVKLLDAGIAEDLPYMAFEYLGSADLRRAMQEPMPPSEAVRVLQGILAGLSVLHGDGLAHMDIKPENIFFRRDDSVVLIDFTLATRFGSIAGMKSPGEVMGTPFYMSPEHGQGLPVDGRADLYSAGVVFFEMLTGAKPFQADNAASLIYRHIHEEIPLLPAQLRSYQPLVDRLLAKQRENRFQTAQEVATALGEYSQ